MDWFKKNPEVRTLDLDVLLERFYFDIKCSAEVEQADRTASLHPIADALERFRVMTNQKASQHRRAVLIQEVPQPAFNPEVVPQLPYQPVGVPQLPYQPGFPKPPFNEEGEFFQLPVGDESD